MQLVAELERFADSTAKGSIIRTRENAIDGQTVGRRMFRSSLGWHQGLLACPRDARVLASLCSGIASAANVSLPFLYFRDVGLVMLAQECRHIAEEHLAHALLRAAAEPGIGRQRLKTAKVCLSCSLERT